MKQKTILKLKTTEKISVDLESDEIKMTNAVQRELRRVVGDSQEPSTRYFIIEAEADAHSDYLTKLLVQRLEAADDVDGFIGDLKYNISELERALAAAVKFESEIEDQGAAK